MKSVYRTIRAFLPGMLDTGGGSIVHMSSVASSVKGVPHSFRPASPRADHLG